MLPGKGLLTPIQKAFLPMFVQIPDQAQFYLSGGTALSEFHLGHRLSFDLALFTAEEQIILPGYGLQVSVTRRFAALVELLVSQQKEHLRVDLALDSPFRFEVPLPTEIGVPVNSFLDLKVDKLLAYYGPAEPRDAVDLYFIFQHDSPDALLPLAAQKDPGFDLYWFAVALNRAAEFPDEVERWPVNMLIPFDPLRLKDEFHRLALALMSRISSQTDTENAL